MLDQDLGVVEAFKASWHQSKDHVAKVYGIIGAEIVMAILCFVIIGIYFLLMYAAANAVLYYFVKGSKSAKKATPHAA